MEQRWNGGRLVWRHRAQHSTALLLLLSVQFPANRDSPRCNVNCNPSSRVQGVAFFVRALPAARADVVRQRVEAAAAPHAPREGDDAWDTLYAFLECIAKRAAKVGGGGVGGGGGGGAGAALAFCV